MSEHEKLEQIGALVEELSQLKGHLAHITEKLQRAQQVYAFLGQNFQTVRVHDGKLQVQAPRPGFPPAPFHALLDEPQLVEALSERDRLNGEIKGLTDRLKPLAPHLF
jgi:hypothetical protein